jgi:hypothetical protein
MTLLLLAIDVDAFFITMPASEKVIFCVRRVSEREPIDTGGDAPIGAQVYIISTGTSCHDGQRH